MKLLLDEMLPAVIAEQLRRREHDALAVEERPDLRGISDDALFDHAQANARAIVTYNRGDLLELDRRWRQTGREHCGIVILHPRRFAQGNRTIGQLVTSLEAFLSDEPPYASFVHWLQ